MKLVCYFPIGNTQKNPPSMKGRWIFMPSWILFLAVTTVVLRQIWVTVDFTLRQWPNIITWLVA